MKNEFPKGTEWFVRDDVSSNETLVWFDWGGKEVSCGDDLDESFSFVSV